MSDCARAVLSAIGIEYRVQGRLPTATTLVVPNHLSYLDIAIFSAVMPCVFVARHDISAWPVFGSLARFAGTLFVNRESRLSAWDTSDAIAACLRSGVSVLVFPEGTSTDGGDVQRFHSTLFEPALDSGISVTPAAVLYQPSTTLMQERDLCWFGDDEFLPHLSKVLASDGFTAVVRFSESEIYPDRKTAAWRSHETVFAMREALLQSFSNRQPEFVKSSAPEPQLTLARPGWSRPGIPAG